MAAVMTTPGPITPTGNDWAERVERLERNRLRSWEGFKLGPGHGLTPLELRTFYKKGYIA